VDAAIGLQMVVAFLLFAGGALGLPISVPPLPPDPVIERSAAEECLFHMAARGMAEPSAASGNLTERLVADEKLRRFVRDLAGRLVAAFNKAPGMTGPDGDAMDRAVRLLEAVLTRPASLTVSSLSIDPAAGPPAIEASLIVNCGEQADALAAAIAGLVGEVSEEMPEPMRPKPVKIDGREWSRIELPVGGPVTWGFGGRYFILTVGGESIEHLLGRIADKAAKPPAWRVEMEKRMPRERLATLTYLDAAAVLRVARDLQKLGGPALPPGMLEATGLARIETVEAVTGLTAEAFSASLRLDFDGEPQGIFASPQGGIGQAALRAVPRDAVMAQLWKLDLAKTAVAGIDLAGRLDPAAGAAARQEIERLGATLGIDVLNDLLQPLGDEWSFFILPGGGLIPSLALEVSVDDRAAFQKAHDRLLAKALAAAGGDSVVTLRTSEYDGHVLYGLKAGGPMPLPVSPTWCLTENRLLVTALPQLMKTLLGRKAEDAGLDAVPEVKRATAAAGQAWIGYLEPSSLISPLFELYEVGAPAVEAGLAQQRIDLRMPELPAASDLAAYVRPSVSVVRRVQGSDGGILIESTATLPLGPLTSGVGFVGASPVSGPVLVGLLLPAVQAAREAARRSAASNNIKQILLAMLNDEAAHRKFPAPAICDELGKPLLSWRVAMLPYMEEQELYERFRLDEPWDSDHNRKLIPLLPAAYQDPAATPDEIARGLTSYQMLRGRWTAFPSNSEGPRLQSITDGLARTLAVVEVSRQKAVPWTKPEDLTFDKDKPLDGLGTDRRPGGLFLGGFFDGHVETFTPEVAPASFRAMASPSAGDTVGP